MSRRRAASYVFIVGLFVTDRLFKILVLKNPNVRWDFIAGWFGVSLVHNRGIAFGIPVNQAVLFGLVAGALMLLVYAWLTAQRRHQTVLALSLSLIIVGAVSNLIDRLRYGSVIDYLDVPFFTVFNLADVMISGGVGLLIVSMLWGKGSKSAPTNAGQKSERTL